jgi:hypothetical protein
MLAVTSGTHASAIDSQISANPTAVEDVPIAALAARANTEHAAYEATQSAAVAHAIAAGEALTEAKDLLPHGAWLPWLRENIDFSARTASSYMRMAANRQRVTDLPSVRSALADLASPRGRVEKSDLWTRWKRVVGEIPPPGARAADSRFVRLNPYALDPRWRGQQALEIARLLGHKVETAEDLARALRALADEAEQGFIVP